MKKILIDANPIVPYYALGRNNGIGRTCMELISQLERMRLDLPFEIELYTQNIRGVSGKMMHTGFKSRHAYIRNTDAGRLWAKRLHLRELLSNYDLQHITHNFEVVRDPSKCIVTIHDVMFFSYPENFLGAERNRRVVPPLARKARHVITISENSKREIMEYMDVKEENITVIPWGVDHTSFYPHIPGPNRWCGKEPYFISVSCDKGRKNTITLLKAYEKFARQAPSHHLVLVWRTPTEEACRMSELPHLKGLVHFASNLTNQELAEIYAGATASFFPSLYEGFGLPIAESMACGVPCVTADNSSLTEIGGEVAIYVNPMDASEMADVMARFENNGFDLLKMRTESIKQAAKFTWEKCATSTVEVYKQCLEV